MNKLINDSKEFQAALIYPERVKRGVSPHWRTVAIIGWIVVGILTAISARGNDFAGRNDLALREPTRRPSLGRCVRRNYFDPTTAPVTGVSPATEPDLAGCPPTFAARRHRGIQFLASTTTTNRADYLEGTGFPVWEQPS